MSTRNDRFVDQAIRHPLIVLLMASYIGWLGYSVIAMQIGAATIQANNDALTEKIGKLEKKTSDNMIGFTKVDSGQAVLRVEVDGLKQEVEDLEDELNNLKQEVRLEK